MLVEEDPEMVYYFVDNEDSTASIDLVPVPSPLAEVEPPVQPNATSRDLNDFVDDNDSVDEDEDVNDDDHDHVYNDNNSGNNNTTTTTTTTTRLMVLLRQVQLM